MRSTAGLGRPEGRLLGRRRPDRGAAAVEFALVALPLFLIVFGIIQYGLLFSQVQGADYTAKQAAGWAARGMADCDEWQLRTLELAGRNGVADNLSPTATADFDEGAGTVTVTLAFTPLRLVPFVPIPSQVDRSATTDLENPLAPDSDPCT